MFLKKISSKPWKRSSLLLPALSAAPGIQQGTRTLRQLALALIIVLSMLSLNPEVAAVAMPPNFEDTFVTSVSGPTDLTWTPMAVC